jgi:hypothetical protein
MKMVFNGLSNHRTTENLNSANNSSRTTKDSGVAPLAGVYQILTISVDSTGSNVYFYIDGMLVQTHTSSEDIPTGAGRQCGQGQDWKECWINNAKLWQWTT